MHKFIAPIVRAQKHREHQGKFHGACPGLVTPKFGMLRHDYCNLAQDVLTMGVGSNAAIETPGNTGLKA